MGIWNGKCPDFEARRKQRRSWVYSGREARESGGRTSDFNMDSKAIFLALAVLAGPSASQCQSLGATPTPAKHQQREQTTFASDTNEPVQKPAEVPDEVLQILRDNLGRGVVNCIENDAGLTPQQVPASWFVASEIHLDGRGEVDLIVRPQDMIQSQSLNRCLFGAHAVPFWDIGQIGSKYELLFNALADGLRILNSRRNGYRNIQIWSLTAVTLTTSTLKFDGYQYRLSDHKKKDKP